MVREEKAKKERKVKTLKESKERDALVTSRVLFVTVLDKIYLISLVILFALLTANNFSGDISSLHYGFWLKLGKELVIIIGIVVIYLLLNWFYKCAVKTMLCLTEKEVYKESYVPFKTSETTIPLNKITGITTFNVFWIFRSIIIHQYGKLPMVFFTWNNQEFKDKLNELITKENKKIKNEFENKNIITEDKFNFLRFFIMAIAGVICFIGLLRLVVFVFGTERRMVGTYEFINNSRSDQIVLESDGTCDISDITSNTVTKCTWDYDNDTKLVTINYEYKSYYSSYTFDDSMDFEYNKKNKELMKGSKIYTKVD